MNLFQYCFFRLQLLLSLSLSLSELDFDVELDPDPSDPDEFKEFTDSNTTSCCCVIIRGIFFKYSRRLSVTPPRPIDVKKLMENLVSFGLSLGNIESNESCIVVSLSLSLSRRMPRCSANSCHSKLHIVKWDK